MQVFRGHGGSPVSTVPTRVASGHGVIQHELLATGDFPGKQPCREAASDGMGYLLDSPHSKP